MQGQLKKRRRRMDKLIITVPSWIVCIVGIWFTLTTIETGLNLYACYLSWKLRKLIGANKEKKNGKV